MLVVRSAAIAIVLQDLAVRLVSELVAGSVAAVVVAVVPEAEQHQ